ncbi:MAG: long-chain-fatty-acid--CoA ligase [Pseudomonadota bacterium]
MTLPPQPECLIHAVLAAQAAATPDAIAIEFCGEAVSYATFDAQANRVANALVAAGVEPGTRIAILAKNCTRFLECVFGIVRAGAVATPISWRLAPSEVEFVVRDADAPILFYQEAFTSAADTVCDTVRCIRLDGEGDPYAAWIGDADANAPSVPRTQDDIALQLYTSGTTGRPKGAMLSQRNLNKTCNLCDPWKPDWLKVSPGDRSLVAIPMFHIGGLESALRAVLNGGTALLHAEFDAEQVLDAIQHDRPTIIGVVPTALQMMVRHPKGRATDYSSVRYFFYGASPIPADLLCEALDLIGCGFVQAYGMTETVGAITYLSPEDHEAGDERILRSAGRPNLHGEVKVIDAAGNTLPPGEVGEILLRAPYVMAGYWKKPEASAEAVNAEGWLHTGDAGLLDAEGYLFVLDRLKDMIISGGENIYPAEVEDAMHSHPAIAEVAVIGVPDPVWGEAAKAIIVLRPDAALDASEILGWTRKRIAGFKVPKSIDLIDEMPRGPSGKILRRELMVPYWKGQSRAVN